MKIALHRRDIALKFFETIQDQIRHLRADLPEPAQVGLELPDRVRRQERQSCDGNHHD